MQIHARARMRPLGHDARDQRDIFQIQLVRQPLHGDGLDERIRHDDLLLAHGRRVAVIGRLHVGLQHLAQARQAVEKFQREVVRRRRDVFLRQIRRRMVFEALADFVLQRAQHRVEQFRRRHLDFRGVDRLLVEEAGKQQPQQILGDGR